MPTFSDIYTISVYMAEVTMLGSGGFYKGATGRYYCVGYGKIVKAFRTVV
jgi:hypothetical protein